MRIARETRAATENSNPKTEKRKKEVRTEQRRVKEAVMPANP